jgi:hypothetical protein
MKQFYFHLRTGDDIVFDLEGSALADYSSARREAEHSVRELLSIAIKAPKSKFPDELVIANEDGLELGTVSFREVLSEAMRTKGTF